MFAKYYDRLESQYRDYDEDSRWIRETLELHKAGNVLDASCGTGNHIAKLASDSNIECFAMDLSREMVQIASQKQSGERTQFLLADFLHLPFSDESFDSAICMYWSLAGLDETLVTKLFTEINSVLSPGGIFIFDVENSEGIKENLIGCPFIDSFFTEDGTDTAVIRANLSTKKESDLVDWRAYYLIEDGGVSELFEDRMNLRFYSKLQLEDLLYKSGFETLQVLSGPFKEYRGNSPSLYFVAQKKSISRPRG